MGNEILDNIALWNKNSEGISTLAGSLIIGVIVLFVVLLFYKKYNESKKELSAIKTKFANLAREMSIEGELLQCLLKMEAFLQPASPIKFITNTFEYDDLSAKYLSHLLQTGIKAGEYENTLLHVTKIRQRIAAKSRDHFKPINSTQDLYSGLDVSFVVKEGDSKGEYDSKIASASKQNLVIHSPTKDGKKVFFENGTVAHFTFTNSAPTQSANFKVA